MIISKKAKRKLILSGIETKYNFAYPKQNQIDLTKSILTEHGHQFKMLCLNDETAFMITQ